MVFMLSFLAAENFPQTERNLKAQNSTTRGGALLRVTKHPVA